MFALIVPLLLASFDLGGHFAKADSWTESAADFAAERQGDGFGFAGQKGDVVNCMGSGKCTWHGIDVWEARIYYGADGVNRVEMSLYNRGDDTSPNGLDAAGLEKLLEEVASKAQPGGKIGPNPEKKKLGNGGVQYFRKWSNGDCNAELTWGVSGANAKELAADYVRVSLYPKGAPRPKAAGKAGIVSKTKARSYVKKNKDGDVWIDGVPMVDQGRKGYCAAAASERVLRYYGFAIDEHEIAQAAGTTAQDGTSISNMVQAVRAVGSKCRLGFSSVRVEGKRFLKDIKAQVDQGVPLFWGVTLGMFPEPGIPQATGGHIRLIIGYNQKTHEILYTDSWGVGHELKRMPEDRAFAITREVFFLRPL